MYLLNLFFIYSYAWQLKFIETIFFKTENKSTRQKSYSPRTAWLLIFDPQTALFICSDKKKKFFF